MSKGDEMLSLNELCQKLSISVATGKNWVRLGKVEPSYVDDKKGPMFAASYVNKLEKDLSTGKNTALKSRRNKKFVSGNGLYSSYVSGECRSLESVQRVLVIAEETGIELNPAMIRALVADCAEKLFEDAGRAGEYLEHC